MQEVLLGWAGQVLGRSGVVQDCTWEHRMSRVLRLRDEHGAEWFLKRHLQRDRYDMEVAAYRRWVPALGGRAPRLRSCDDRLQAIIVSAVPGEPAPWPAPPVPGQGGQRAAADLAVQQEAGALLRLLHDAQPPLPWPGLGPAKTAELDQLAPLAAGLLTPSELGFARSQVAALAAITTAAQVPCHHDYTPRNWLLHDGAVRVIDFEWTRLDTPLADLARLHLGAWEGRPDLREGFLDGYGSQLDNTGHVILRGCAALTAVWLTIKARETSQPSFESASRAALRRLITEAALTPDRPRTANRRPATPNPGQLRQCRSQA